MSLRAATVAVSTACSDGWDNLVRHGVALTLDINPKP
jgi:hypothetical protein